MPVEFVPVSDYAGGGRGAGRRPPRPGLAGRLHLRADPPEDRQRHSRWYSASRTRKFTSKFITADPAVKSLADLKGKTFAFGSVSSTSGSLMPRYFMLQDGIEPEQFFSRVAFSGAHDATVAWVQAGKVDGGVLNSSRVGQAGRHRQGRHRQGAGVRHHADLLRLQLDRARHPRSRPWPQKIKAAFLALDPANPEHKAILDLQAASRFIETSSGELRRHRGRRARGRPAEVTVRWSRRSLRHANGVQRPARTST